MQTTNETSGNLSSTAAHTPGPWEYVRDCDYWEIQPTNIGGKDNMEGNEADYRLIAAAPELLEAAIIGVGYMLATVRDVEKIAPFDPLVIDQRRQLDRAIAAIVKATGRDEERLRD